MDATERDLFASALVGALSGADDVDAALSRFGWDDALAGDPRAAVSVLFDWQGRSAATSGAVHRVMGAALGSDVALVVLPALGSTRAPGRLVDGALEVRGLLVPATARRGLRDELPHDVVVVADGGGLHRCRGLAMRAVSGLDPALGLVEVTGTVAPAPEPDGAPPATAAWSDAVAAGQRAIGHELVGAAAAMLELARQHALDRVQFGVPIASFQAVRHRLADSLVAVESARGALDAAWEAGSPFDAMVAKAIAGRGARLVAKHAQQVLAGVGFTLEHPLHRYVRRVRLLDGLLGDARTLTRQLGEQLLQARALPAILPL